MVADWHGSGRGRHSGGARTTTMFLPAALLHDDDAMACQRRAPLRAAPLPFQNFIWGDERRREQSGRPRVTTNRRFGRAGPDQVVAALGLRECIIEQKVFT